MNILSFQKPSRYINHEVNSVHKSGAVGVALAFPDVYEVGMSHLGLRILSHVINSMPFAFAERVFFPWLDLEAAMREKQVILTSLESNRPVREFDVLGFSLQYELSYPTVLSMLALSGIPLRSADRGHDARFPLVIAGGPCTVNPLPMSAFIDAFLIGDGEEAVGEILGAVHDWKNTGSGSKQALLESLSEIEGVYVPLLGLKREVRRRHISSLEDAPFPARPVVPYAEIIHDRINIEIARGCSQGCRFCLAGMICRPVRERSPGKVLELAEASLRSTGYDSISFTSLSAGDYSCLTPLMKEFNRRFSCERISLSLPSLRVSSVNREVLREIKSVRKTGFTFAPEAGTPRLRSVINKDFSEEQYVSALETLFSEGWHSLKMYFMLGLPTETDEDISAIGEMVHQAMRLSRKISGRPAAISVGVSPFVPKPHTPFQWIGQTAVDELKEKNMTLRRILTRKGVKFKGHDERMSLLEAVLARGDESLAGFLEHACMIGCRLDAWTEAFDFSKWEKAADQSGTDAFGFATRTYPVTGTLPWEHVSTGITREYLLREYENAMQGRFTADCRKTCHACGLKCEPEASRLCKQKESAAVTPVVLRDKAPDASGKKPREDEYVRVRLEFSKTGAARYLSHLELMNSLIRAMRRAGFPFRYSGGFHPAPKISLGPALRVGIAGLREYLDVEVHTPFSTANALAALRATLPEGIAARRMEKISLSEDSLSRFIIRYTYMISHGNIPLRSLGPESESIPIRRKEQEINLREMVEDVMPVDGHATRITVRDVGDTRVRIDEITQHFFSCQPQELEITRHFMHGWDSGWREPFPRMEQWAVK